MVSLYFSLSPLFLPSHLLILTATGVFDVVGISLCLCSDGGGCGECVSCGGCVFCDGGGVSVLVWSVFCGCV